MIGVDATIEELAQVLYVDSGDVRTVLEALGGPSFDTIPQEVCGEVCDVLDPWPMPRRFPDDPALYRDEPANPLALE